MVNSTPINGHRNPLVERIADLDRQYFEARKSREPQQSYFAGEGDRMNPIPKGIDPLGTDADYHYLTERNYFLMVERARNAVRNHPLVEQAINRLVANLKLGDFTLDVDSGDEQVDKDQKEYWDGWTGETSGGRNECDYEGTRTFQQLARQSFFSQAQDGDIMHIPLVDGRLQTWESHHIRSPYGHRPTGLATDGIVHGVEVKAGQITAYHVTPLSLQFNQALTRLGQTRRIPAFDDEGNRIAFWMGFRHRFYQRRGISRLSPPREAMSGFDDLNYAHIKSALRRAIISYLMESTAVPTAAGAFGVQLGGAKLPQVGDRYAVDHGLGLQSIMVEQAGEPAQVFKTPEGYRLEGWNANLPGEGFFEHASLMLTMLAVNLDLPLMFLLLDGSLVNFHGGRMTFDQCKLRFMQLQSDQIQGLWNPVYHWKTRQRLTPGTKQFDRQLFEAYQSGRVNPFNFQFRPGAWPYVKPMEDAAAEDLAERRNLKSLQSILAARGVDIDDHIPEVISGRGRFARAAIKEAIAIAKEFPELNLDIGAFFRELWYGNQSAGVQLSLSGDISSDGADSQPQPKKGAA